MYTHVPWAHIACVTSNGSKFFVKMTGTEGFLIPKKPISRPDRRVPSKNNKN
jgi:hypothetical protein